MANANLATQCVDWWLDRLQSIAELHGKVLQSYSDTDLMNQLKNVPRPNAGVLYEGIVGGADDAAKTTHKAGLSGQVGISVVLLVDGKMPGSERGFNPALELLDKIRQSALDQRSPSHHFWRFVAEGQATEKNGVVVWVQRWATPIQLVR